MTVGAPQSAGGSAFAGRCALVTGGTRGIGEAVTRALHEAGASVVAAARTEGSAERFRSLGTGPGLHTVVGDLDTRSGCHDVVAQALGILGALDILVTCAGTFAEVPLEDVTQRHWDATVAVNLGAVFFCAQAAMPALAERNGNIVTIASDAGLIGYAPAPAYGAAKGGVVSLSRTLAYGYAGRVRVNCVCPGNVATDMLAASAAAAADSDLYLAAAARRAPVGRVATPAEIAAAVLYFAGDSAGFTTGVAMPVDGGGMSGYG